MKREFKLTNNGVDISEKEYDGRMCGDQKHFIWKWVASFRCGLDAIIALKALEKENS